MAETMAKVRDKALELVGVAVGLIAMGFVLWGMLIVFRQLFCYLRTGEWVELSLYQILVLGPWAWDLNRVGTPWDLVPTSIIGVMEPVENWAWVGFGKICKWVLEVLPFSLTVAMVPFAVLGLILVMIPKR